MEELTDNSNLVLPGEDTIDENNLVNTTEDENKPFELNSTANLIGELAGNTKGSAGFQPRSGVMLYDVDVDAYSKYIDEPFSFIADNPNDLRAYNQSTGEKILYGLPKLGGRIMTNIIGAIPGSVYGLGAAGVDLINNGPDKSNMKAFFDNDFNRGLDAVNEWMDDKLPHYYTQEEQEAGFWQSLGSANFWTNDFSQGLSFVAGAVLSEMILRGIGGSSRLASAKKILSRSKKPLAVGTSAKDASRAMHQMSMSQQLNNFGLTSRQLITGAGYEAGIEARHHYDATVNNLVQKHKENNGGQEPTQEEMLNIVDIATMSSNGVFSANLALVGYSNYMMFPKIFGRGYNLRNKSLGYAVREEVKDGVTMYRNALKDLSKFQNVRRHAWKLSKRPLYEGFGEEGGQRWADLAGQYAAERYYTQGKDPSSMDMVSEMLNSLDDTFVEAYGSPEGGKEIGIGVMLAALGLPSFVKTDSKTNKQKFSLGLHGGILGKHGYLSDLRSENKAVDDLVNYANENPDAFASLKINFENMVRGLSSQEDMDAAQSVDDIFGYKNAQHDAFFSFVQSRVELGYWDDVVESINSIRDMDIEEFKTAFEYGDVSNLTDDQLQDRKNDLIKKALERANKIKDNHDNLNSLFGNFSKSHKRELIHTASVADNLDEREEALIGKLEELASRSFINKEYDSKASKDEKEYISLKDRLQNAYNSILGKSKELDNLEDSEEGKQLKHSLGIKEFTTPSQLVELHNILAPKAEILSKLLESDNLSEEEKESTEKELDRVTSRIAEIKALANAGIDPELSSEEAQLLEEWRQEDPGGYAKGVEEATKILKDLKKIRARRHAFIDLLNQLKNLDTARPKIQLMENVINDIRKDDIYNKISDSQIQSLYAKYEGQILEFEYVTTEGITRTYRVRMENELDKDNNPVLTRIPTVEDAYKHKYQQELDKLKDKTDYISENRKKALREKIAGLRDKKQTYTATLLKEAKNIRVISSTQVMREKIEMVSEIVRDNFGNELRNLHDKLAGKKSEIKEHKDRLVEIWEKSKSGKNFGVSGQQGLFSAKRASELASKIQETIEQLQEELFVLESNAELFKDSVRQIDYIISEIGQDGITDVQRMEKLNTLLQFAEYDDVIKQVYYEDQLQFNPILKDVLTTEDIYHPETGEFVESKVVVDKAKFNELGQELLNSELSQTSLQFIREMDNAINLLKQENSELLAAQEEIEAIISNILEVDFAPESLVEEVFDKRRKEYKQYRANKEQIEAISSKIDDLTNTLTENAPSIIAYKAAQRAENLLKAAQVISLIHQDIAGQLAYVNSFMESLTAPEVKESKESKESNQVKNSNPSSSTFKDLDEDELNAQQNGNNETGAVYTNQSSIGTTKLAKTIAGEHDTINSRRMALEDKGTLTSQETLELENINAQLRLNAIAGLLTSTRGEYQMSKYNFMIVTRNNIPDNLKDKIVFYDVNAKKNFFKLANDYTSKTDPQTENIKLVLVDLKGNPVEFSGGIAYANLSEADVFFKSGEYKYSPYDLNKDGTLKPDIQSAVDRFKVFRANLTTLDKPAYTTISGTSKGFNSWINGDKFTSASVLDRIVNKVSQIKDINLYVAKASTVESNIEYVYTSKGLRGKYKVGNGMPYISKNQNMIPGRIDNLSEAQISNIYNILRLWGQQQAARFQGDPNFKEDTANYFKDIDKSVFQILRDYVFFGEASKAREDVSRRFYIENNVIQFGEKSISFAELADLEGNTDIHNELLEFLSTLTPQINGYLVDQDVSAREVATNKNYKLAKVKNSKRVTPEYTEFIAVSVNDNLEIDSEVWNNYTEYLLSPELPGGMSRSEIDIPVKVNITEDYSNQKEMQGLLHTVPQIKGRYIAFNSSYEITESPKGKSTSKVNPAEKSKGEKTAESKFKGVYNLEFGKEYEVSIKYATGQTIRVFKVKPSSVISTSTQYAFEVTDENKVEKDFITTHVNAVLSAPEFYSGTWGINDLNIEGQELTVTFTLVDNSTKENSQLPPGFENSSPEDADHTGTVAPYIQKTTSYLDLPILDQVYILSNLDIDAALKFREAIAREKGELSPEARAKRIEELEYNEGVVITDEELIEKYLDNIKEQREELIKDQNWFKEADLTKFKEEDVQDIWEGPANSFGILDAYIKSVYKSMLSDRTKQNPNAGKRNNRRINFTPPVNTVKGTPLVDLNNELLWFNENMPTDLFSIELIRGLIDGKYYGELTREGQILLSNEAIEGALYHESWHAATRFLIKNSDRIQMYDEVRGTRGKAMTYSGEYKKLASFTDKEADEWLAEEFREYVLQKGDYKVGGRVKKSFLDRIFDFLSRALRFFTDPKSKSQDLMDRINTGHFAKASIVDYNFDENEKVNMSVEPSASFKNDIQEGMTMHFFNIATREDYLDYSTATDPTTDLNEIALKVYGNPVDYMDKDDLGRVVYDDDTVYGSLMLDLSDSWEEANTNMLNNTGNEDILNFFARQRANISDNIRLLADPAKWAEFKDSHAEYLTRWDINMLEEEAEEDKQGRNALDFSPSNEVDPNKLIPKPLKLLIATLPMLDKNNNPTFNSSGFARLADFGLIISYLYKNLTNLSSSEEVIEKLYDLSSSKPEIYSLVNRLGLNTTTPQTNFEGLTSNQAKLLVSFLIQMDQSANDYLIQQVDSYGGRYFTNANSVRVSSIIRDAWQLAFKTNAIDKNLGRIKNGKNVLNTSKTVSINGINRSIKSWLTRNKALEESFELLKILGISFTAPAAIIERIEEGEANNVKEAIDRIFDTVLVNNDITDLYSNELYGRMKTLVDEELKDTNISIDLQHRNPDGKTVYGITLKTFIDKIAHKLNGQNRMEVINNMLSKDNMANSYYLKRMLMSGDQMKVSILEGYKEHTLQSSKHLSKSNLGGIGLAHMNAIFYGHIPIIRPADSKTEYAIKLGEDPSLAMSEEDVISVLQGYLYDEILVTNKVNTASEDSLLKRVGTFSENAKGLRFFKDINSLPEHLLTKDNLTSKELQAAIQQPSVVEDLKTLINRKVNDTKLAAQDLRLASPVYLGGIDKDIRNKIEKLVGKNPEKVYEHAMKQLTYLQMIGMIEQSKIFLGDLGLYTDLFKRVKGVVGAKKYPVTSSSFVQWMEDNMPYRAYKNRSYSDSKGKAAPIRSLVRGDIKVDSEYINDYKAIISVLRPNYDLSNLDSAYMGMDEFDGGGMITLDSYRRILNHVGQWTDRQENLYQMIMDKQIPTARDIAYFPPLKPQVWAPLIADNVELKTFHKFALFPVHPQLTRVVGDEQGLGSKVIDEVYEDMITNHIDYQIFNSVTKVGGITNQEGEYESFYQNSENTLGMQGFNSYKPIDLDIEGNVNNLLEFDFEYFGIQVDMAPKRKNFVTMGTQSSSILPINIYDNGSISEEHQGQFNEEQTWEEVIEEYHTSQKAIIDKDITALVERLGLKETDGGYSFIKGDSNTLKDTLLEELSKRDIAEGTKRGIVKLFESDTKYINQLYDKSKLETILYAIATSSVIKRKMPGGMAVLQSSSGYEIGMRALKQEEFTKQHSDLNLKKLRFYRKPAGYRDDPNAPTLRMQVYLPHFFKEYLGEDLTIKSDGIYKDGIKVGDANLLEAVGFRIPTEGINSLDAIEIVGFLPEWAGDNVIVPTEIVGKSGSDYDIDKLTIYVPNYKYRKGKLTKIKPNMVLGENATMSRLQNMRLSEYSSFIGTMRTLGASEKLLDTYETRMDNNELISSLLQELKNSDEYQGIVENIISIKNSFPVNKSALKEARADLMSIAIMDESIEEVFPEGATKTKLVSTLRQIRTEIEELDAQMLPTFSKLNITEQNTKKAIQNQLQDIMSGIILHPTTFPQLINPVGAGILKRYAKEISDLRMAGGRTKAGKTNWADVLDFGSIINTTYRMQSGIGGTGIVAVNSTHHAKSQRAGLGINPQIDPQFNFEGMNSSDISLSRAKDIDNNHYISEAISMYITGYVDVTKDDFVFDINAGKDLAGIHMLLLRAGIPLETVAYFMSQPVIDDYIQMKNQFQGAHLLNGPGFLYRSNAKIENTIKKQYGKANVVPAPLNIDLLKSMVGLSTSEITKNPSFRVLQRQIFDDFLRYKEYSDMLFYLGQSTNYDTSRLKNFSEVKFMEAMNRRVRESNFFINESRITDNFGNPTKDNILDIYPTTYLSSFKRLFEIIPSIYSELDYKAKRNINQFMSTLAYTLSAPDSGVMKEDILYHLDQFDNFISTYIVTSTMQDKHRIHNEIKSLFQGRDSLPRKINRYKTDPKYSNNLLIQEFYPVLQSIADKSHPDYTIDNLKLFNKRLQIYDINLLADSYTELKQLNQSLALDILKFSVLQSGFSYNPSAFLQALPADEVLKFTGEYFSEELLENLNMDNIYRLFIQNNAENSRIVKTSYVNTDEQKKRFREGEILSSHPLPFIAQKVLINKSKEGISTKANYFTKLFQFDRVTDKGNIFREISKRGLPFRLINTGSPILSSNTSKYGLSTLTLKDSEIERILNTDNTIIHTQPQGLDSQEFLLPNGAHVKLEYMGMFNEVSFRQNESIRERFGVGTLDKLAKLNGYKTYDSFEKSTKFATKPVTFYTVQVITEGYTIKTEDNALEASATQFESQDEFSESRNLLDITSVQAFEDEIDDIQKEGECLKK